MARGKREGLLIAGGGLSGCLAALAIAMKRPDVPILLVEEGERFGGQQTWSFFDTDIEDEDRWLVEPLIAHHWSGYYVAFPGHSRKFRTGYSSIRSEDLEANVRALLRPEQYRLGTRIAAVREREIVLTDGETIKAEAAIDARGAANLSMLELGWRKFVGRDYVFERPHGLELPVAIDATVEPGGGYRFVSCLPLDEHRMLVGDHSYSASAELDVDAVGARLDAYVARRRWAPGEVVREESGVLPVPTGGDFDAFLRIGGARVAKLGLRGGLFHPVTGHALPDAVRTAAMLAQQPKFDGAALHDLFAAHSSKLWKQRGFYRSFNAMLLRDERRAAMERLHRLQGSLIERFFAARSSALDRMRIGRTG
ncbi:MAG: lycopene beta-cyclase CrtY [Allosphingosinicella sp.]|uniref:lycopene beta-cyclase CrtY n=1 Tax=Allosphingosinicella sp. TaxID=2823234 RepID=UPI0039378145